uniref:peptide deformylase n=1 Tax=Stenotrophomonas maltophilia TaxID=40324 RepID=UPI0019549621
PMDVILEYQDEQFNRHEETFTGLSARIIMHEYDHIDGKLFIDYLKPLRKKMLQGKLNDISKGKTKVDYKMVFIK